MPAATARPGQRSSAPVASGAVSASRPFLFMNSRIHEFLPDNRPRRLPEPVSSQRSYAARSMGGSQFVPVRRSAARSAISPFLSAAMFSAAFAPFASLTA
jgi:hypothetical protein